MRIVALAAVALALAGPAAAADREVLFGDAFTLDAADPRPFDRLADGRVACLSDACAGRTVTVGGVTVRVGSRVTPKQATAKKPPYRAPADLAAGRASDRTGDLLLGGAVLLALGAAALAAPALRRTRRPVPADGLRRALRLLRESARRPPPDRRRALDHVAAALAGAPPAERATRLAWGRPDPEPAAALEVADEVRA